MGNVDLHLGTYFHFLGETGYGYDILLMDIADDPGIEPGLSWLVAECASHCTITTLVFERQIPCLYWSACFS